MTVRYSDFFVRKLSEADRALRAAPTVTEGLYTAFAQSLRWLDPEHDAPAHLRQVACALYDDLAPIRDNTDETPNQIVMATLRAMPASEARALAERLRTLAAASIRPT